MTFLEKIKLKLFWTNFLRVFIPFFIIVIIVALIMGSAKAIFSGNFSEVLQTNFADGKWKPFFAYKILFTSIYGLWMTNKKM